jgi:hypothetical protein
VEPTCEGGAAAVDDAGEPRSRTASSSALRDVPAAAAVAAPAPAARGFATAGAPADAVPVVVERGRFAATAGGASCRSSSIISSSLRCFSASLRCSASTCFFSASI